MLLVSKENQTLTPNWSLNFRWEQSPGDAARILGWTTSLDLWVEAPSVREHWSFLMCVMAEERWKRLERGSLTNSTLSHLTSQCLDLIYENENVLNSASLKMPSVKIFRQYIKKQRHHFTNKGPYSQSYGFSSSNVWMWKLDYKKLSTEELMPLNCGVGEYS